MGESQDREVLELTYQDLWDKEVEMWLDQFKTLKIRLSEKQAKALKRKLEKELKYQVADKIDRGAISTALKGLSWLVSEVRYPNLGMVDSIIGDRKDISVSYSEPKQGDVFVTISRGAT